MDQKVEIKEEPVLFDEKASTSFASADVKDELTIEEPTVDQLVQCFKEEEKSSLDVSCADHPPPDGGQHLARHKRDCHFNSDDCGKLFHCQSSLSKHVMIHKQQALYECGICKKYFTNINNLTMHIGLHTDSRVPKTVFVGNTTLEFGPCDAVISFNDGNIGRAKVLRMLNILRGYSTLNILMELDDIRIKKADLMVEEMSKSDRRLKRNLKRTKGDTNDASYVAGMF
ncbi:zinc finger protein 236-like [Anabrus simplex]|uniref:zinc finger protein 236-like n=1 Tax=Anabrus simplex TaxID=316456 RepID=UPI0035A35730